MKKLSVLLFFAAIAGLFAQGAPKSVIFSEFAEKLGLPGEYSSDVETMVGGEGGMVMKMKLYISKGGMRSEMELPGGMGSMTTLVQVQDEGVKVYMLNPTQKTYSLLPGGGKKSDFAPEQYQIKDLGQEEMQGQNCRKKAIVGPDKTETVIWQNSATQALVKCEVMEKGNQVIMLFKNFQSGTVDPKLLQIPADYKQGNVMQGFMNLGQ
ncbi:MAG: DUF4412 domain-containing protein [Oligosphaeraceae bacterium]|jgi:outer membrane lipoprotein-sorting protein|nr:DUF4412 domain-containing protein [Oligosphaeraceae bacterium]